MWCARGSVGFARKHHFEPATSAFAPMPSNHLSHRKFIQNEEEMDMNTKLTLIGLAAFSAIALSSAASEARPGGCVKGAIVGGIAGHFVGHGGVGAAAGCAYGAHKRNDYDRREGRSSYDDRRDRR
jgi:hypothetical protein